MENLFSHQVIISGEQLRLVRVEVPLYLLMVLKVIPSLLNPNDIASVSMLKDAASASIYGARGAFGVVLITTKNPDQG